MPSPTPPHMKVVCGEVSEGVIPYGLMYFMPAELVESVEIQNTITLVMGGERCGEGERGVEKLCSMVAGLESYKTCMHTLS